MNTVFSGYIIILIFTELYYNACTTIKHGNKPEIKRLHGIRTSGILNESKCHTYELNSLELKISVLFIFFHLKKNNL